MVIMAVVTGSGKCVLPDVRTYCRAVVMKQCDPDRPRFTGPSAERTGSRGRCVYIGIGHIIKAGKERKYQ